MLRRNGTCCSAANRIAHAIIRFLLVFSSADQQIFFYLLLDRGVMNFVPGRKIEIFHQYGFPPPAFRPVRPSSARPPSWRCRSLRLKSGRRWVYPGEYHGDDTRSSPLRRGMCRHWRSGRETIRTRRYGLRWRNRGCVWPNMSNAAPRSQRWHLKTNSAPAWRRPWCVHPVRR